MRYFNSSLKGGLKYTNVSQKKYVLDSFLFADHEVNVGTRKILTILYLYCLEQL